jgi:hypothetical protein
MIWNRILNYPIAVVRIGNGLLYNERIANRRVTLIMLNAKK